MDSKIIFIISLPRSGSTLLQRILCTSGETISVSETWLLLDYFYTLRRHGVFTEYNHRKSREACLDFLHDLGMTKSEYLNECVENYISLFSKKYDISNKIIIEKTPRYHLIVNELIESCPNAKFIFLWREPIAILDSIVNTWSSGKWNLSSYKIDLFDGIENMYEAYLNHKSKKNIFSIKYEDIVASESKISELCTFCELTTIELDSLSSVQLSGRMGDKTGVRKYNTLTMKTMNKESCIINYLRYFWVKRYLNKYKHIFNYIGYEDTKANLKGIKLLGFKYLLVDTCFIFYGALYLIVEPRIWLDRIKRSAWLKIHA